MEEDKLRLKCYLKFESQEDPTILISYVNQDVSSIDLLSFLAGEFQVKKLIPDSYLDEGMFFFLKKSFII